MRLSCFALSAGNWAALLLPQWSANDERRGQSEAHQLDTLRVLEPSGSIEGRLPCRVHCGQSQRRCVHAVSPFCCVKRGQNELKGYRCAALLWLWAATWETPACGAGRCSEELCFPPLFSSPNSCCEVSTKFAKLRVHTHWSGEQIPPPQYMQMRHKLLVVGPVLTKEIHECQGAFLLQTHGEMKSRLFDPLEPGRRRDKLDGGTSKTQRLLCQSDLQANGCALHPCLE